jgi:DNA-binding helix-hairpin-helix protein with protein kinase domain
MSIQPTLYYPGTGRLSLPQHGDSFALDAMRVAYSFALLHQKGEAVMW